MSRPFHERRRSPVPPVVLLGAVALLGACSGNDDDGGGGALDGEPTGGTPDAASYAFASTVAPDFLSAQVERFTLDGEITPSGTIASDDADIDVATDGTDLYRIGKFMADNLARYAPDALDAPLWQYSVNSDDEPDVFANPYDIVFVSDTKAYVIRYGSPLVWIVDPSASEAASFRTGTIDLSAYDPDGVPEAADALIVDGKLFVLMQRLEQIGTTLGATRESYVAVIDTATDTEIATGTGGEGGLGGIALGIRNAETLRYEAEADEIYAVGRGNFFRSADVPGDPYTGGIATIDPDSYASALLLDDGDESDNRGFTLDAVVISPAKGYVLTFAGYNDDFSQNATLRSFNPITGMILEEVVAGLDQRDIGVLEADPEGRVWVGYNDATMPGFTVIDPSDDSVVIERVPTLLNPNGVVFTGSNLPGSEPAGS